MLFFLWADYTKQDGIVSKEEDVKDSGELYMIYFSGREHCS